MLNACLTRLVHPCHHAVNSVCTCRATSPGWMTQLRLHRPAGVGHPTLAVSCRLPRKPPSIRVEPSQPEFHVLFGTWSEKRVRELGWTVETTRGVATSHSQEFWTGPEIHGGQGNQDLLSPISLNATMSHQQLPRQSICCILPRV